MKCKTFIPGLFTLICYLFACQPISKRVESSVEATKDTLNERNALQRRAFEDTYSLRRKQIKDQIERLKLDSLYAGVTVTAFLLDSTMSVLDKIDPNELKYVGVHLVGSLGDSLYKKVNYVLKASAAYSGKPKQKKAIDSIRLNIFSQPEVGAWKNEYFGQTSVFGASMIIHGFSIEVYRAAQISLEE